MATTVGAEPYTVDDLDAMPDDGRRRELIDGTLIVTPAPALWHQKASAELHVLLYHSIPPQLMAVTAPFDWRLSRRTQFEPDILVMPDTNENLKRLEETPELVVEILSKSTRRIDLTVKLAAYQDAGVPRYWVFDPDIPALTVFALDAAGQFVEVAQVQRDATYIDPTWGTIVTPSAVRP